MLRVDTEMVEMRYRPVIDFLKILLLRAIPSLPSSGPMIEGLRFRPWELHSDDDTTPPMLEGVMSLIVKNTDTAALPPL